MKRITDASQEISLFSNLVYYSIVISGDNERQHTVIRANEIVIRCLNEDGSPVSSNPRVHYNQMNSLLREVLKRVKYDKGAGENVLVIYAMGYVNYSNFIIDSENHTLHHADKGVSKSKVRCKCN